MHVTVSLDLMCFDEEDLFREVASWALRRTSGGENQRYTNHVLLAVSTGRIDHDGAWTMSRTVLITHLSDADSLNDPACIETTHH